MSTYYCVVCEKHMERTSAASRTGGGVGPLAGAGSTLLPFLVAHAGCPLRCVSEHYSEWVDTRFSDWTIEQVQAKREHL